MFQGKLRLLLALFAALTLFVAACGDDDDDAASPDEDTTQDDDASSDDAADDDADDADDVAEDADEEATEGAGGELGNLSGDCAFLGEFATTGFDDAFDDIDPFTDGGAAFQKLASEFRNVAGNAPGEIRDEFQTLAEAMSDMADAFAEIDFSDPESIDPSVFESFDEAEFEAAGERIEAWLEDNCPGLIDS